MLSCRAANVRFGSEADIAEILTDTIDTRRSLRLEVIIVILIAVELVIAGFQVLYSMR